MNAGTLKGELPVELVEGVCLLRGCPGAHGFRAGLLELGILGQEVEVVAFRAKFAPQAFRHLLAQRLGFLKRGGITGGQEGFHLAVGAVADFKHFLKFAGGGLKAAKGVAHALGLVGKSKKDLAHLPGGKHGPQLVAGGALLGHQFGKAGPAIGPLLGQAGLKGLKLADGLAGLLIQAAEERAGEADVKALGLELLLPRARAEEFGKEEFLFGVDGADFVEGGIHQIRVGLALPPLGGGGEGLAVEPGAEVGVDFGKNDVADGGLGAADGAEVGDVVHVVGRFQLGPVKKLAPHHHVGLETDLG